MVEVFAQSLLPLCFYRLSSLWWYHQWFIFCKTFEIFAYPPNQCMELQRTCKQKNLILEMKIRENLNQIFYWRSISFGMYCHFLWNCNSVIQLLNELEEIVEMSTYLIFLIWGRLCSIFTIALNTIERNQKWTL